MTDKILPSAVGDIHLPGKAVDIDTSFEFIPQNPFTMSISNQPASDTIAHAGFPVEEENEKPGFLESFKEEFKEKATDVRLFHALDQAQNEKPNAAAQFYYPDIGNTFLYKPTPDGWTPKQAIEKLTDIDPKYMPKLLNARNPQDFQYRLDDIYAQKRHDQVLENGSTFGKIIGGLVGYSPIGSIENFIPFASLTSKAKVGYGFINNAFRNIPSVTAAAAIRNGADQMDKMDKSLPEFITNTFVDAAFGTVFMGAVGGAKSLINLSEFNRLKDYAKTYVDGIGFKYVVDKAGELTGFKAVPLTQEPMNAAKLTKAQELADSAFYKGGLFKIPYVGAGALAVISGNVPGFKYLAGSPLIRLVTSKYAEARAFANSAFDHFITTQGEAEGGTRPPSFELKMKQTRAMLTGLKMQTTALHAERNGYTITNRPAIGIQNAWAAMKQKTLSAVTNQTQSTDYVSEETFMDEVQRVLHSEESSEHSAVNQAAALYRKVIDDTYRDYRIAHNLPEDWLPPKTASAYLMRVYDIKYLNENEGQWNSVVSNWLKQSDEQITQLTAPISQAKEAVATAKNAHKELIKGNNVSEMAFSGSVNNIEALERKARTLEDNLSNRMRTDQNLYIHIDDPHALSADEAKEIKKLLKPKNDKEKLVETLQQEITQLKQKKFFTEAKSLKTRNKESAKSKLSESEAHEKLITDKTEELRVAKDEVLNEEMKIQDLIAEGKVKHNLYEKVKDSNQKRLKDPSNRLKFRNVYESDSHRLEAAQAYYHSILNMKPEDIIADVFGKLTGNTSENVLKQRTLPVPDEILYNNNFMTKDLHAKTANYVNYLGRRTHLKTSFENVTVNGGYEELAEGLLDRHKSNRQLLNERLDKLHTELDANPTAKKQLLKDIQAAKKELKREKADFEATKKDIKTLYEERMMGLNKRSDFDNNFRRGMMSLTAAFNLHNLPGTQIGDLAFGGFQHGIWPFVRDGIYPIIQSMMGILKTKDSEALREMAPHLHLGYQDVANHYADKNWSSELQPYINMGKISSGVQKFAHFSALTDLSPYIDNGVQHAHGSVIQSRFMELLHKHVAGTLTEKESLYLRKYGIDPRMWSKRMVDAYKAAGGSKTSLGGYISKAWQWQDLEASNVFNQAVFRGIQNTLVWKGMADSPFFADNLLGMFFHTFTGWSYAAANRYLIPSMQHPDGELLLKMIWMGGAGALVSPLRRISRGEDAWPDDMTNPQIAYEAFSDSGVFSTTSNVLNIANFMSDDKLLGDLKNDKFRNRVKTGIFGTSDVVSSTASRVADVLGMIESGLNEQDLKKAARMLPITGSMYGHYISDKLIEHGNFPKNKRAAQSE